MSARRGPVEFVGPVAIYAPTPGGKPYHRLKWREADGRTGDTQRATLAQARALALEIARQLAGPAGAAGGRGSTLLSEVAKAYVAAGRSPHGDKHLWEDTYRAQVNHHLTRMLRAKPGLRAAEVTGPVLDLLRTQAGTPSGVKDNTRDLRGLLTWGALQQPPYFTKAQVALLPQRSLQLSPALAGTVAPPRSTRARQVGESEDYVAEEDAPSLAEVRALATELQQDYPLWGELAVEVAAGVGLRWGEQFQLRASDVHLYGCARWEGAHMHVDWQVNAVAKAAARGAGTGRSRPKGNKVRTVPIVGDNVTGYPLVDALAARVEQALSERATGCNREALLFPALRGGMLWHTSFSADHLLPAMTRAGWPMTHWVENHDVWDDGAKSYVRQTRSRVRATKPWHSLRHRFARTMIDRYNLKAGELMVVGGWEDIHTVETRYYHTGLEHLDSAGVKLGALAGPRAVGSTSSGAVPAPVGASRRRRTLGRALSGRPGRRS